MKTFLSYLWVALRRWSCQQADIASRCRSCGHRVRLFEKTCPHCGAGESARVPLPAVVVVMGLPVAILFIYFGGKWLLS